MGRELSEILRVGERLDSRDDLEVDAPLLSEGSPSSSERMRSARYPWNHSCFGPMRAAMGASFSLSKR